MFEKRLLAMLKRILLLIATIIVITTLYLLCTTKHVKADEDVVAYYRAIKPAQSYTQPSLTNWTGGSNAGDLIPVSKLGYYGRTKIALNMTTQGWTNASNLKLDDKLNDINQVNQVETTKPQYKPHFWVRRHYYTQLSAKHYAQYKIKTKRRIGVYASPKFTTKALYTLRKHKTVSISDLAQDKNNFRFVLDSGDYITAAKNAVKLYIK